MSQTQTRERHADDSSRLEVSSANNLPPRDPKFVGRSDELDAIHARLGEKKAVGITQYPVPYTQGGLGKTALAIAYGWQHLADYPGGVFYVNAASGVLISEIAKLADALGVPVLSNEGKTATSVAEHLASGELSLVILDGVDDASSWQQFQQMEIVSEEHCRCLITTRLSKLDEVSGLMVGGLLPEHGTELLAAFRPDAVNPENEPFVRDIVKWLDGYPLGLTLVGGYMALNLAMSWMQCRHRLTTIGFGPTSASSIKMIHDLFDEVLNSLTQPQRLGMEYSALLPNDFVPINWLRQLLQSDEVTNLARIVGQQAPAGQQVVSELLSLQILRPQSPKYKLLTIPRMLRSRLEHHFARDGFQLRHGLEQVIGFAGKLVGAAELAIQNAALRAELTPLVQFTKELAQRGRLAQGAKFANQLSLVLHRLGRYHEVIALLDAFVGQDMIDQLDPKSAAVLLSDKAVSLAAMGKVKDARGFMERAIEIEKEHLPPNDPTFATRYSNLAGMLKSLGELGDSRHYIEQAIEIEEQHFGADHQTLGLRYWWLGDIEVAEGRGAGALTEYERAYEILRKHFPSDHPHIRKLQVIIGRLNGDTGASASHPPLSEVERAIRSLDEDPNEPFAPKQESVQADSAAAHRHAEEREVIDELDIESDLNLLPSIDSKVDESIDKSERIPTGEVGAIDELDIESDLNLLPSIDSEVDESIDKSERIPIGEMGAIDELDIESELALTASLASESDETVYDVRTAPSDQAEFLRESMGTSSTSFDSQSVQTNISVSGGQIAVATQKQIHERLVELHHAFRSLKVFHVDLDCHDENAASAEIKAWGTATLDRAEAEFVEPDIIVNATATSIVVAVDDAIQRIEKQLRPKKSKDPGKDKASWKIPVYVWAGGVLIALLAILFALMPRGEVIDEAAEVEAYFKSRLTESGLKPESESIFIPIDMANRWYGEASGRLATNARLLSTIRQYADEERLQFLRPTPSDDHGIGLLWAGAGETNINLSLRQMMRDGQWQASPSQVSESDAAAGGNE